MASTNSSPPNDSDSSLNNTIGALYLAALVSTGLWGAGTIQVYLYYNNYPKDSVWLKIHVLVVWVLDSLHQALLVAMVYRYLITGFGDFSRLMQLDKLLVYSILVGGVICLMVQWIFVMRVWKLSGRNILLTSVVASLVAGQFVVTCIYFVKAIQFQTFAQLHGIMTITRIVNAISAAADSAIALCLVVLLYKNRTPFKQSQSTINRLIMFTVNTGLVTGLCAALAFILGFVAYNTLLFMFFFLLVGRLYMNSLLATLNSRNSLRRDLVKGQSDMSFSNGSSDRFRTVTYQTSFDDDNFPPLTSPRHQSRGISVTVERVVDRPFSEGSKYSCDIENNNTDIHGELTPADVGTPDSRSEMRPLQIPKSGWF